VANSAGKSQQASSVPCNACGGGLTPRFPRVIDPDTGETFAILACSECGLGHTIPQPEDLRHYYSQTYHGGRHGFTAQYCANRRLRIVNSLFRGEVARSILDVGCGDGTFLFACRTVGWTVRGIEIKPDIARRAGLKVDESVEDLGDAALFDCITLWHSLEHLRDPRLTVTHLVRLLKEDGAIVIAVPDAAGLQARFFGPRWFHLDPPRHLYHFGPASVDHLLDSTGLVVERRWHQELEYDLLGWSQSALNLLMPVPNAFFRLITGRPREGGKLTALLTLALGGILTAASLPAVAVGTISHRGGTLVTVARKK